MPFVAGRPVGAGSTSSSVTRPRSDRDAHPHRGARRSPRSAAAPAPARRARDHAARRRRRPTPAARRTTRATPARALPSSGPDDHEIISTPASRPRSRSGIVSFQSAPRNTPEIASAPPASARHSNASHSASASPNSAIATPQPRPRARSRGRCGARARVQPLVTIDDHRADAAAPRTAARPPRPAVAVRERREQRERHAEEHRVDVDAGRSRAAPGATRRSAGPRRSPRSAGGAASGGGGGVRIERERRQRGAEGREVERRRSTARRWRRSARRRAPARRSSRHWPASRSSALAALSSSRSTSRGISASSGGRRTAVSAGESAAATYSTHTCGSGAGVDEQRRADDEQRPAPRPDQLAAVERVRERAADQRQQRRSARTPPTPSRPTRERRAREVVDLDRDRDLGEHRPEQSRPCSRDEQPQVAPAAQQREVGEDHADRRRASSRIGGSHTMTAIAAAISTTVKTIARAKRRARRGAAGPPRAAAHGLDRGHGQGVWPLVRRRANYMEMTTPSPAVAVERLDGARLTERLVAASRGGRPRLARRRPPRARADGSTSSGEVARRPRGSGRSRCRTASATGTGRGSCRPHDLDRVAARHVDAAVERAQHVAREAQHAGEARCRPPSPPITCSAADALRLAAQQPQRAHAVAADVHQRAALEVALQAHVLGVARSR